MGHYIDLYTFLVEIFHNLKLNKTRKNNYIISYPHQNAHSSALLL